MKTILIDDEYLSLQYLQRLCLQIPDLEIEQTFSDAKTALCYIEKNTVDLMITDIEMPGFTGMEAVWKIREKHPNMGIIFITGYEQYAFEAFQVHAVAYILKPCSVEDLIGAVERAKVLNVKKNEITVKTFGLFSLFLNGKPCNFSNRKAQELFAYLIDANGGVVSMEQIIDVLWEERNYDGNVKRLYRKAVSYLNCMFDGMEFFVSERAKCYIVPDKIDCDYYRFLKNPNGEAEFYNGEYMSQYSWAEATNGKINRILQNRGLI